MTPEETEAAQRVAQAKLDEAKKAIVHTRTRSDKRAEIARARSSRGMWIALGVGTLAAVVLIVGLLFLFFALFSFPQTFVEIVTIGVRSFLHTDAHIRLHPMIRIVNQSPCFTNGMQLADLMGDVGPYLRHGL